MVGSCDVEDGFRAYRQAFEGVAAAEESRAAYWADGSALAAHERYWRLVEAASGATPSPERFVQDNHPEAWEAATAVATRSAELAAERDLAAGRLASARSSALAIMGDVLGVEAAEAVSTGVIAAEAREAAYAKGESLAQENLGLKHLQYDHSGPFTIALHQRIAAALELPVKGKGWLAAVDRAVAASELRGLLPSP